MNAKVVQELPFVTVAERLEVAAVGGEPFWMAVRQSSDVGEACDWWRICTQPITPIIDSAAVTDAAADLLPEGDLEASIWQDWTKAVAAASDAKGRGLFMPLRLALTGLEKGPEIAPLLAFMGRERVLARLRGETA